MVRQNKSSYELFPERIKNMKTQIKALIKLKDDHMRQI